MNMRIHLEGHNLKSRQLSAALGGKPRTDKPGTANTAEQYERVPTARKIGKNRNISLPDQNEQMCRT